MIKMKKIILTIFLLTFLISSASALYVDYIGHQSTYLNGCNRILESGNQTIITYTSPEGVIVSNLTKKHIIAPFVNDHFHSCIHQDSQGYYHLVYGARPNGIWYVKSQRQNNFLLWEEPKFVKDFLTYPIFVLLNDKPFLFVRYGSGYWGKLQMYNLSEIVFNPFDVTLPSDFLTPYPTDYYKSNLFGEEFVCVVYNNRNTLVSEFCGVEPSIREYINFFCTDGENFFDEDFNTINTPAQNYNLNKIVSNPLGGDGDSLILPENIVIFFDGNKPYINKQGDFIIYIVNNKLNDMTCSEEVTLSHYPSDKVVSLFCDDEMILVPYEESIDTNLNYIFNILPQSTVAIKKVGSEPYFVFEYKRNIFNQWNLARMYDGEFSTIAEGSFFHPTIKDNIIYASEFNHTGNYSYYAYDGILTNSKLVKIYLNNLTKENTGITGVYPTFSKFTSDFLYKDYSDSSLHFNLDVLEKIEKRWKHFVVAFKEIK